MISFIKRMFSAKKAKTSQNAISVIFPFLHQDQWVFTDKEKELDKEPFVAGADTLLDKILTLGGIDHNSKFKLIFSANKFPGAQFYVTKLREYGREGGTDYYSKEFGHDLWLCPALLKYFDTPPGAIYFQIKQ